MDHGSLAQKFYPVGQGQDPSEHRWNADHAASMLPQSLAKSGLLQGRMGFLAHREIFPAGSHHPRRAERESSTQKRDAVQAGQGKGLLQCSLARVFASSEMSRQVLVAPTV